MSERAQEPQTWLINIGGYGEFEFIGTEEEAEAMRRHKSAWEGGVGTKKLKPADPVADSIDVEKERLEFEAYIARALPSPELNLQRKSNSSPDFVVDYARPCIDSQWCGWLAAKRSVMSTAISNGKMINHDEALQLSHMKLDESNLARCYIDLSVQLDAVMQQKPVAEVKIHGVNLIVPDVPVGAKLYSSPVQLSMPALPKGFVLAYENCPKQWQARLEDLLLALTKPHKQGEGYQPIYGNPGEPPRHK